MEKPLNLLHPLANYKRCSRNYARAWEICCPSVWPHKPHSKSQWCQKRFLYLRRREEPLRPPVYWPCVISVHQESCLQRWTLLRTVLWMVKIKRIIWVRCAEASMLHLNVSIKGIPGANAKLNEVEKDVYNVYALQILWRMRGWEDYARCLSKNKDLAQWHKMAVLPCDWNNSCDINEKKREWRLKILLKSLTTHLSCVINGVTVAGRLK